MIKFIQGTIYDNTKETPPRGIYVDGTIKGPRIDVANGIYSFDHHCDNRFAMTSATFQVVMAIQQGLNPKDFNIYVNHTDADSVLAVSFLLHPEWVTVSIMPHINQLSRIDNHGAPAIFEGEQILKCIEYLMPVCNIIDSEDVFMSKMACAEIEFTKGTLWAYQNERQNKYPGCVYVFDEQGQLINAGMHLEDASFTYAYKYGGFAIIAGDNGMITIGKKPLFSCPSFKGLIYELNKLEPGWGGADSIMGSPRPNGTKLEIATIVNVVNNFIKGER